MGPEKDTNAPNWRTYAAAFDFRTPNSVWPTRVPKTAADRRVSGKPYPMPPAEQTLPRQESGAAFIVYSSLRKYGPWYYTVEAGKQIDHETWSWTGTAYDLSAPRRQRLSAPVQGPVRHRRRRASGAADAPRQEPWRINLVLSNLEGRKACRFTVGHIDQATRRHPGRHLGDPFVALTPARAFPLTATHPLRIAHFARPQPSVAHAQRPVGYGLYRVRVFTFRATGRYAGHQAGSTAASRQRLTLTLPNATLRWQKLALQHTVNIFLGLTGCVGFSCANLLSDKL